MKGDLGPGGQINSKLFTLWRVYLRKNLLYFLSSSLSDVFFRFCRESSLLCNLLQTSLRRQVQQNAYLLASRGSTAVICHEPNRSRQGPVYGYAKHKRLSTCLLRRVSRRGGSFSSSFRALKCHNASHTCGTEISQIQSR